MSILIHGLNKPYSCRDCVVPYSRCDYHMNRAKKCPLEEINLVRCVDCRFLGFHDFYGYCEVGNISGIIKPWDYCSRGENNKEDM